MTGFDLRSTHFRREREASWRELEGLLDRVEALGIRGLSHGELFRLPALYRGALGSLSVARAISLDRNVLRYLENLASRAYLMLYASRRAPGREILNFVLARFPATTRRFGGFLAVAIACLLTGVASGYLLTTADLERYYSFVPAMAAQGRDPSSTTESLREALYAKDFHKLDALHLFASFLFTHNAKVGMLCFALGFAAGVPVIVLLFQNGLLLGAMAALYRSRGLDTEFWAWILPHGISELLAVCLCGAAGLVFGAAVVFPGRYERLANLGRRGRQAALLVAGAVAMFFVAALIEGIFRQVVHDVAARFAVAGGTLAMWGAYFALAGRGDGGSEG